MSNDLLRVVSLPFCQAVMLEDWDAAPGRFYAAWRARHGFTALLGSGVVDEFRTISGPILLAPATQIGGVYDVGMRLADQRDVEAPIDQGWPPLTLGIDVAAPIRPDDWREKMLSAMRQKKSNGDAPWQHSVSTRKVGGFRITALRCKTGSTIVARVVVSDAPMLPAQLDRLADTGDARITIAVSVGNRLPRIDDALHVVDAIAERQLERLVNAAATV